MAQSNYYLGAGGLISNLTAAPYSNLTENAGSWLNGYGDDVETWRMMPNMFFKVQFSPSWSFVVNYGADYIKKIST